MARQDTLPRTLAPRLVGLAAVAAYCSVSPNAFLRMVDEGKMPQPKIVTGRRKAWDLREIDLAIDLLPTGGEDIQYDLDHSWQAKSVA